MKNIAVIGAGTMGNGIAHVFALHGFNVSFIDVSEKSLAAGFNKISTNLDRQIKKGEVLENEKEVILDRIKLYTVIEDGLQNTDLVIEAITENYAIKSELIKKVTSLVSETCIIASNTSSISITKLASNVAHPERVVGMHFMNPVPVMPLIEIIAGYKTSNQTLESIHDLSFKLNKTPLKSNDYPGFVANRILMPMINEAIYTLFEGVADVKEIDGIMKLGMAHPMGPLQLADFIGLDVCLSILRVLQDGFGNPKYAPCPLLVNMVQAGDLGVKTGKGFYEYENGKIKL